MNLESYKDQIYSCLRCGFCFDHIEGNGQSICPPYAESGLESYGARGKIAVARALLDGVLAYDEEVARRVFSCTECGACEAQCFKYLSLTDIYTAMKQDLAKRELLLPGAAALIHDIDEHGNPYRRPRDKRLAWLPGTQRIGGKAEVLFFVGCTPSLLRRGIARATYQLLEACGVDFSLLEDETCCGHPFMVMGMPDRTRSSLDKNLESIRRSGAETLVFACPGCLRTFREDYVKLTGRPLPVRAVHITEYLAELPAFHELKLKRQSRLVTYHDPCTLGRSLGILDAPRQLIDAVPGVKHHEMPRTGLESFCCGSGGFVRTDYEDLAVTTGQDRFSEALATGADAIVSACPACQTAFLDAKQRAEDSCSVDVLDIAELLAASL